MEDLVALLGIFFLRGALIRITRLIGLLYHRKSLIFAIR